MWRTQRARHRHATVHPDPAVLTALLLAARRPIEFILTKALRRVAAHKPEAFERLGAFRNSAFVVAPRDLPIAFLLRPSGSTGTVQVIDGRNRPNACANIHGALGDLLSIFDGSQDADAAFFSRRITVTGDTEAIVTLHNTLEAADLRITDLIGVSPDSARLIHRAVRLIRKVAQSVSPHPAHEAR